MFENLITSQIKKQEITLEKWLKKHDEANPFPHEKVTMQENVKFLGEDSDLGTDVFIPKTIAENEKLPILIDVHGGGYLLGKKEANRLFCAYMAQKGFVVFCPEYPLAPEKNFFEILEYLTATINAICLKAAEYGADGEKLYLCGDSAGAHLCLYLAAIKTNKEVAEAAGIEPINAEIKGLALQSGMFYTTKFDQIGMFLPKLVYGKTWKKSAFFPYINPENAAVTASLPPTILITAKGDFLRHYTVKFSKALLKADVKTELIDINKIKLPHAFTAMLPENEHSIYANDLTAKFLSENN
ncbi:MAG TPA: hypothetical protein DDY77_06145 [Clostridiales bacterium]|nr:hypothetical protein [Clostridiales bacterium]